MPNKEVVAGIDIGGTKIAIALQNSAGELIVSEQMPTQVELGPHRILENVSLRLEKMVGETGVVLKAIGVGTPGPIDIEKGVVLSPTNLPDWIEFPLVEIIENRFRVPTALDNDANAAALGEYFYGAGKGFADLLYVTISTGVGGAIIINGELLHGLGASAGEVGHTIVQPDGEHCRCGAYGCLETIASGLSIARRARERAAKNSSSLLHSLVGNLDEITAEIVVKALEMGDRTAIEVWDETCYFLGIGIGNAITLIAPQVVVIGGGVASVGDLLLKPLRRNIHRNVTMLPVEDVAIIQASLGKTSGVCGALILARKITGNLPAEFINKV